MPKVTATIITKNEAANIDAAIASVRWADEIVVIDAESTDDTAERARRSGARVDVRSWPGYSAQKNYAASIASHDWILSLDADERVTPELAAEIQALLATEPARRGYRLPRISHYLGRWIRGTDWYPDYQLRLYDRRAGTWNGRRVHESVALNGEPGQLRHDLQHFPYRDISDHLATIDRYTTLAAEQMRDLIATVFHEFVSMSIQHLMHEMGQRILARFPQLAEVSFDGQNRLWDTVAISEADPKIKSYCDPRPPYGSLHLTLRR